MDLNSEHKDQPEAWWYIIFTFEMISILNEKLTVPIKWLHKRYEVFYARVLLT